MLKYYKAQHQTQTKEEKFDWNSFLNLMPIVFLLLIGAAIALFGTRQFQMQYYAAAWIGTAIIVLRIQQIIEYYSHGHYPYKFVPCAALLVGVVLSPWAWLHLATYPVQLLAHIGLVKNNPTTWIIGFTLTATACSLAFVTPMVEGWYELLRGSFAFDGTRIKYYRPSLKTQVLLLAVFCGVLLAPIKIFGAKMMQANFNTTIETGNILGGFFATFLALIWLLVELEQIRLKQISDRSQNWSPVDKNLVKHAGKPMADTMVQIVNKGHLGQINKGGRRV
jgi:hypothetical protein